MTWLREQLEGYRERSISLAAVIWLYGQHFDRKRKRRAF
jgi:hypothetical protein